MEHLKLLIILIFLGYNVQAQNYENDGVITENGFTQPQIEVKARIDSAGGFEAYMNQMLDIAKLKKSLSIYLLANDDTLQDTIASIIDTTNFNIYVKTSYNDREFWPRAFNNIPDLTQKTNPLVLYSVSFSEAEDSMFLVKIKGQPQGIEIDADNKAISLTEFTMPFNQAYKSAKDTLISKIRLLSGQLTNPLNKWHITFAALPEQLYGTDVFKYPELTQHYEYYTINGEGKNLTYKSVENGHTDKILAISDTSGINVNYKTPSGLIFQKTPSGDNTEIVTVTSPDTRNLDNPLQITACYTQDDEEITVGKLNVLSYPKQTFNVVLVPVNNNDFTTNATIVQNGLNDYYRQAITSWNVTIADNLNADFNGDEDPTFNANPEDDDNYTIDMGTLISYLEDRITIEPRTFYIFLIEETVIPDNRKGIMPYLQPYGFLFTKNISDDDNNEDFIKTLAHELGHGAFRLPHFELANNLMSENDLTQNNELLAIQWDIIQGNAATLNYGWEEGVASTNNIINFSFLDGKFRIDDYWSDTIKIKYPEVWDYITGEGILELVNDPDIVESMIRNTTF